MNLDPCARPLLRDGAFMIVAMLAGAAGCSSGPSVDPYVPTATEEQMYAHFRNALELRAGAVFGDLDRLKDAGERLAKEPIMVGMPPGSERFERELRQAAAVAAGANEHGEGRLAAADIARTCGSCHNAYRVGPDFVVGGPPPGETLQNHMARQTRISRLLWDGLIGPSDQTWQAGAEELKSEPPFPQEIAGRVRDPQVLEESRSRLRDLGGRAAVAIDPSLRSALLGEVWGVCAGCHTLVGRLGP